jgi:hypothetical protein
MDPTELNETDNDSDENLLNPVSFPVGPPSMSGTDLSYDIDTK